MNETRSPKLFMGSGLVFGAASMLCNVLGFSTPYWLQVWPRVGDTTFRNLGLWQVCISGFRNPRDLWGKISHGCWWIFAREYEKLREDDVILPSWFKAVQTMASFSFICNCFLIISLLIVATTSYRASVKVLTVTATLAALTSMFALIAVSIFGAFTDVYRPLTRFTGLGLDTYGTKGKWMPRPEYTFLSWSYICEVFCAIFAFVATIIMFCESYFIRQAKILYEKQSLRSSVKSMPASLKSSQTQASKMELDYA